MTKESRALAAEIFRSPIENFSGAAWPRARCGDLRKFLAQRVERMAEKKLATWAILERLE